MSDQFLPRPPANHAQERRGINAVAVAAANGGQIWRETPLADVGIDGQLEFVDDRGYATGKTIAVQVKSGPSYLASEDAVSYHYTPALKHRAYWERYPLPVLLMLHDPDTGNTYWTDARQHLRDPGGARYAYIPVPKINILQSTPPSRLFETAGVTDGLFIPDLPNVMIEMISRKSPTPQFPLSFFDLFTHGLTQITRSVYFGMDLAITAAECNLAFAQAADRNIQLYPEDQEFLFDYIKFLVTQNLAHVDFSDCLVDWINRQMQPEFVAPLSARGRQLIDYIDMREDQMTEDGTLELESGLRVCQEGIFRMEPSTYLRRLPRISKFQRLILERETTSS